MSLSDSFLDPESLESSADERSLDDAASESDLDFELRFFERILHRNADYVDVLRCQGELLSRRRQHAAALEVDRRLAKLRPHDCIIRYNLACSLAMQDHLAEAVTELKQAFERGYDDFDHLEVDRDMDRLRQLPAFQALMKEYGIGQ